MNDNKKDKKKKDNRFVAIEKEIKIKEK